MQKDQAGAAAVLLEQQLHNAQAKWAAEAKARAASEKWLEAEMRSKARKRAKITGKTRRGRHAMCLPPPAVRSLLFLRRNSRLTRFRAMFLHRRRWSRCLWRCGTSSLRRGEARGWGTQQLGRGRGGRARGSPAARGGRSSSSRSRGRTRPGPQSPSCSCGGCAALRCVRSPPPSTPRPRRAPVTRLMTVLPLTRESTSWSTTPSSPRTSGCRYRLRPPAPSVRQDKHSSRAAIREDTTAASDSLAPPFHSRPAPRRPQSELEEIRRALRATAAFGSRMPPGIGELPVAGGDILDDF